MTGLFAPRSKEITFTDAQVTMKQHNRRRYFTKKDFQARLFLPYLLFAIGGGLFFIVLLWLFLPDSMIHSYLDSHLPSGRTSLWQTSKIVAAPWLFIVLSAALFLVAATLLTHRRAGPLFRFKKTLDNMLQGNLHDTIALRCKDEGKELAGKINAFNAELAGKIKNLQIHSEAIAELLEQCRIRAQDLPPGQEEELNSLFWGLAEKNKKIKGICDSFPAQEG